MGVTINGTGLTVMQALELARESPEGAQNPAVVNTLETAIAAIWANIQARADYVMTRDEFAIFNYFQSRFAGNELATAARGRYWQSQ